MTNLDEIDDEVDFSNITDPRQSTRLQKVREAKEKISSETELYQEEVKRMQEEIRQYKQEIKKKQLAEIQMENQINIKQQLQ